MAGRSITWFDGQWHEGNPPMVGPLSNSLWLASTVFDGARAFEGVAPDLNLHCARCVRSAHALGMNPGISAGEVEGVARAGLALFPADAELYIRPMFYAETGFVVPDPDSTRFVLTLHDLPMPRPGAFSACLSSRRRPLPGTAPAEAKASCLYPNVALALKEARARGYDNAILLDPLGHVAEFAIANLFIAEDGVVHTPVPNGTFLDGITRQRVIGLLRNAGVTVIERTLTFQDVLDADEVFSTGNYAKVAPVIRIEHKEFAPGPVYERARRLYWDFAHR